MSLTSGSGQEPNSKRILGFRSLVAGVVFGGLATTIAYFLWLNFNPRAEMVQLYDETQTLGESSSETSSVDSAVHELLNKSDEISDFELRTLLYESVSELSEDAISETVQQLKSLKSSNGVRTALIVAIERLVEISPKSALSLVADVPNEHTPELIQVVFNRWSLTELKASIEASRNLSAPFERRAIKAILDTRHDLSDSAFLEQGIRTQDLVQRAFIPYGLGIPKNPEEQWFATLSDKNHTPERIGTLVNIAEEWWSGGSDGILKKIVESIEHQPGLRVADRNDVLRTITQVFARHNPARTFAQLSELNSSTQETLMRDVVSLWALSDPIDALKSASKFESEQSRTTLTRIVAQFWAQSDPTNMVASLSSMAGSVQRLAIEEAILVVGRSDRQEALDLLRKVEQQGYDSARVIFLFVGEWSSEDPNAAIQWIVSNASLHESEQKVLLEEALREIYSVDTELATDLALDHGLVEHLRELQLSAIEELAWIDVDAAIALLPNISEIYMPAAVSTIGGALVYDDQPMRAIELAALVPDLHRPNYRNNVINQWALHDPKHLFESISSLSSTELQLEAATTLKRTNRSNPTLSDEEMRQVELYLQEN